MYTRSTSFLIIVINVGLSLIGLALVPRLTVKYQPTLRQPNLYVSAHWRDASPQIMEREVTSPLEAALSLVEGIKMIRSASREGRMNIDLELEKDAQVDLVRFEVATRLRQVYGQLPDGVSYPQLDLRTEEEETMLRPMLTYSVAGPSAQPQLYLMARDDIVPQLALTEGVQKIDLVGANENEWVIAVKAESLSGLGLTLDEITAALQKLTAAEHLGTATINATPYTLRMPAVDLMQVNTWLNHPLKTLPGKVITLREVATMTLQEAQPNAYYRINGQNSLRLLFYQDGRSNMLTTAQKVKEQVQAVRQNLPPGYAIYLDEDSSAFLSAELNKIGRRSAWSLGILLLFVLIVYRGWHYVVILMCSLLINLALASIGYYAWKVELNLYALAGITVTFGIIMDNSIIMVHHLLRRRNLGVFPAILSSTLTTLAALVVIFFLPELWKVRLIEFGRVIIINLVVSLLVSLFFVPAMMVRLGLVESHLQRLMSATQRRWWRWGEYYHAFLRLLMRWRKSALVLMLLAFGLPVFLLPNQIKGWSWYNNTLGSDYYVEHVKPLVNRLLGGTLRLFMWYVYEGSTFRDEQEVMLYVNARMPEGATINQMNEAMLQVERYLQQFRREIKQYVTSVTGGQQGQISIRFNAEHEDVFPYLLKNRVQAYCTNLGGMEWSVYGVGRAFSTGGGSSTPSFRVAMKGYNQDELARWAQRFADSLKTHPRVPEVNTEANFGWWDRDRSEYRMQVARKAMISQGYEAAQIQHLFAFFNRFEHPSFYGPGNVAVRVTYAADEIKELWDLNNRPLRVDSSRVALGSLASLVKTRTSQAIHKEDQQYLRIVQFEYTGSGHFGSKYLERRMEELRQVMPLGYSVERSTYDFWGKEEKQKVWLLLLVMALIFFISAIHFESLRQALAMLFLIPTSFIGIFLTFYWFDFSFDQGGYTSFLLLSGLVVNSLILIVSEYQHLLKKHPGRSAIKNYLRAVQRMIAPILLTILSTALGLIPFLTEGDQEVFWFALAVGTIGGLMFSIVVILAFIPVFVINNDEARGVAVRE